MSNWQSTRHDKYYDLAKQHGYRSRAAYKLIQLNKKYNFLGNSRTFVDLCAAPGGWMQVAVKFMPISSIIVGVDLLPIKPMRGAVSIIGDITTTECRAALKKQLRGNECDVVACDGAPNVGGGQSWTKDAYLQNELVLHALRFATDVLRKGGTFITKIFRSQDYNSLLWVLQQFFHRVDVTKPLASRSASAEIFAVCQNFYAPKSFDSRLLDASVVFQQFNTAKKTVDVMREKKKSGKQHRSREGYEDDAGQLMYKTLPAVEFIHCDDREAINLLGEYHSFTFAPSTASSSSSSSSDSRSDVNEMMRKLYEQHPKTTDEIKFLLNDLKVLGKGDFRSLLRWRKSMRIYKHEFLKSIPKDEKETQIEENDSKPVEINEKEQAQKEMEELDEEIEGYKDKLEALKKREKKRKKEAKSKQTKKMLLNKNNLNLSSDVFEGEQEQQGLFTLSTIQKKTHLEKLENESDEMIIQEEDAEEKESEQQAKLNEEEDEEDENAYFRRLERETDAMYDAYKQRKKLFTQKKPKVASLAEETDDIADLLEAGSSSNSNQPNKGKKRSRKELGSDEEDDDGEGEEEEADGDTMDVDSDESSDDDEEKSEENPLLVSLKSRKSASSEERMNRWFDRQIFRDEQENLESNNDKPNGTDNGNAGLRKRNGKVSKADEMFHTNSEDEDDEDGDADDDGNAEEQDDRWQQPNGKKDNGKRHRPAPAKEDENEEADEEEEEEQDTKSDSARAKLAAKKGFLYGTSALTSSSSNTANDVDESTNISQLASAREEIQRQRKKGKKKVKKGGVGEGGEGGAADGNMEFEEVAAEDYSEYSDDEDAIAERWALGTLMLRKKSREQLIETSYNRYSYNDEADLPEWFATDEAAHNKPELPVTREQVDQFKLQLKAINARPARKIAEAQARNKQRTAKRWQKIKSAADQIAASDAISNTEKLKSINKLYHKQAKKKKQDRVYVFTKKGGGNETESSDRKKSKGSKIVQVDSRMKKDKKLMKVADRRKQKQMAKRNNKRVKR